MSEFMFGSGRGYLSASFANVARKHGAELVNYTDPQCICGRGCNPHRCPMSRRHWFAAANRGEPFNSRVEQAVMSRIERVKELEL